MKRIAIFAVFTLATLDHAGAQTQVLDLHRGAGHLRTITVRAAGRDVEYLFDTGGGVTVISPEDSAALGCTPGGKSFGVRLTGEALSGHLCANVPLAVGSVESRTDAGVMDLAKLLGPNAPRVHGMISLESFRGKLVTLDLAADRLIVETPVSFADRVRHMTPIDVRLATGPNGGELEAFVGIKAPDGAMLWFEWDSENNGTTLVAPQAAVLLGADTTSAALDMRVTLAPNVTETVPARLKRDMIHDGVLSAALLERATWSVDLEHGKMWMSAMAPIPELPTNAASDVAAPSVDPTGVYETTAMVGGRPQRSIVTITREHGELTGAARAVGDDGITRLQHIGINGEELSYEPAVQNGFVVRLTFDGNRGTGTWGDGGAKRGGTITAIKRR